MAEYDLAAASPWSIPPQLFARGSILRGIFADLKSPIAYGYDGKDLPVYFNQDPVLNAGRRRWRRRRAAVAARGGPGINGGEGQNVFPNVPPMHVSPLDGAPRDGTAAAAGVGRRPGRGGGAGSGRRMRRRRRRRRWRLAVSAAAAAASGEGTRRAGRAAVPGTNAERYAAFGHAGRRRSSGGRAAAVDVPLGQGPHRDVCAPSLLALADAGHLFLAFNAIMNWDHLDAGKAAPAAASATSAGGN